MLKSKGVKALVMCTLAVVMLLSTAVPVMAATNTGKVTVSVLNLRSGKSLVSSIIDKIPMDTSINILDDSDSSWIKVSYNGKTGYVSKEYVKISGTESQTTGNLGTALVTVDVLNVREKANTSAKILTKLNKNQMVNAESKANGWYYVVSGSIKGYVSAEYIKLQEVKGKVNVDSLNVRSAANLSSSKVTTIKKNAEVVISSMSGDWYYIKSGSIKGYVFFEYITLNGVTKAGTTITKDTATKTSTLEKNNIFKSTVDSLNVRKTASLSGKKVATLSKGNQVTFQSVAKEDANWYQITTSKGVTGYVHKDYLAFYSKPTTKNTATTAPKSVNPTKAEQIIAKAKQYLGVKYVYGAASPSAFDCSGFTQYVFKQYGVSLSRSALAQSKNGVAVSKANLQPGDLVFFKSYPYKTVIGHVGLYIGGGQFIHAASGNKNKVVITKLSEPYYVQTYMAARRVL